ncbi:MAG: hypothetical protein WC700_19000 [Gemmatimonadaceae bacterium]
MTATDKDRAFAHYMRQVAEAREDPVKYAEMILRDEVGARIRMAVLHEAIYAHIEYCRSHNLHAMVLVPFGMGKSVLSVARLTYDIGRDHNIRAKLVCGIEADAEKRLGMAKTIILSNAYRTVFPNVRPNTDKKWTGGEIFIERTASMSMEPTLEARAILGEGVGVRADEILFDDVVTLKNAVLEPANRNKVIDVVHGVWMYRLEQPRGFAIWLATPYHEQDCTNYIFVKAKRARGKWCVLRIPISKDCSRMRCEVYNAPRGYEQATGIRDGMDIPLWFKKFPQKVLLAELEADESSFTRGRWLTSYSAKDLLFPSFPGIWRPPSKATAVGDGWPRVFGVDLASHGRRGNVIFCGALSPAKRRHPLEIRIGKWSAGEWARNMTEMWRLHNPRTIVIENNALQEMVIGMVEDNPEKYPWWDLIDHYTTGKQKADPIIGLPGMEMEFSHGAWEASTALCSDRVDQLGQKHAPDCDCGRCRWQEHAVNCDCGPCTWRRETGVHTRETKDPQDTVLAAMFFDHGCRTLLNYGLEGGEEQSDGIPNDLLAR